MLPAVAAALLTTACTHGLHLVEGRPASSYATTGGPSESLIYAKGTAAGVVLVDAGWFGAGDQIPALLSRLGAEPADVAGVLITHSHRDHIAGWPAVSEATFFTADAELELLHGRTEHGGWLVRWGDRLDPPELPEPGEIRVRTFSADTILTFGADTVRAFVMPGHTAGSAAYLMDGVLFVGDGLSHSILFGGFRPPVRRYSEDAAAARRSLLAVLERARPRGVRAVCTAHANCGRYDEVIEAITRGDAAPSRPLRARPGSR